MGFKGFNSWEEKEAFEKRFESDLVFRATVPMTFVGASRLGRAFEIDGTGIIVRFNTNKGYENTITWIK